MIKFDFTKNKKYLEFKAALIQLLTTSNKAENIKRAVEFVGIAARNNAQIVSLPVRGFFFSLTIGKLNIKL